MGIWASQINLASGNVAASGQSSAAALTEKRHGVYHVWLLIPKELVYSAEGEILSAAEIEAKITYEEKNQQKCLCKG